jgi:hypothetical protein
MVLSKQERHVWNLSANGGKTPILPYQIPINSPFRVRLEHRDEEEEGQGKVGIGRD